MDSTDLFSGSQTFIDLLNNQQEIDTPQTYPQIQTPTSENHSPEKTREYRQRWTLPEEKVLVSAWLNTSKDPIVGTEQKGGAFWQRVATYYVASRAVKNLPLRGSNTCKQKWAKLNESVSKFAGCYDFASRQHQSGETEDDVLQRAYKVYFQDQKTKFNLEHAWRLLKADQKWCTLNASKTNPSSKRSKVNEKGDSVSSSNRECGLEEDKIERPMGVKAAKAKGKKKFIKTEESEGSSLKELEEMWAIKEKDNANKEKLSRQKILDSLIAKSEPLTDIEITLKNKLIYEML